VRAQDHADENFVVRNGSLWCKGCNDFVATKSSSVKSHINSKKHVDNKASLAKKGQLFISLRKSVTEAASNGILPRCNTITTDVSANRLLICRALILSCVPFAVLEKDVLLRSLLEVGRGSLPRASVAEFVPIVKQEEIALVLSELRRASRSNISFVHDASCKWAELYAVVIRYVDENKDIQQRCVQLEHLEKSMTSEEQASLLFELLLRNLQYNVSNIRSSTADGCATNVACANLMSPMLHQMVPITCCSHSANISGTKITENLPVLDEWVSIICSMKARSPKIRMAFREATGESLEGVSAVRWFTRATCGVQYIKYLPHLEVIINNNGLGSDDLRERAKNHLASNRQVLLLEGAVNKDASIPFVLLCYRGEGDGYLAPLVRRMWSDVLAGVRSQFHNPEAATLPALFAEATRQEPVNIAARQQLVVENAAKLQSVVEKMEDDTEGRLRPTLDVLHACEFADYLYVAEHTIEALRDQLVFVLRLPVAVPMIEALRAELSTYKRLALMFRLQHPAVLPLPVADLNAERKRPNDLGKVQWTFWRTYYSQLPNWFKFAEEVALVTVSSCSVERVFALCEALFDDTQVRALADLRTTSVTIRYNNNWRKKYSD
jgi:hypothetical protein